MGRFGNGLGLMGLTGLLLLLPAQIGYAAPADAYKQAIGFAAQGNEQAALASLSSLALALPIRNEWQSRSHAAAGLLGMRVKASSTFPKQSEAVANPYLALASAYADSHPLPDNNASSWPSTLLATLFPGAGHALQGRWGDAATAALMVWPMLILTIWAFRRGMGPVTLFFALITVWLWSGTVFSSISLAERTAAADYLIWWQGIWQASGLPGRPL
ncbi:MAG: hypothetical protein ACE5E3_03180 [Mariprofundus sp.]